MMSTVKGWVLQVQESLQMGFFPTVGAHSPPHILTTLNECQCRYQRLGVIFKEDLKGTHSQGAIKMSREAN